MAHEYCITYQNDEYGIGICKHVQKKNEFERSYYHYMYKGVVYKTKKKFLEVNNEVNNEEYL